MESDAATPISTIGQEMDFLDQRPWASPSLNSGWLRSV